MDSPHTQRTRLASLALAGLVALCPLGRVAAQEDDIYNLSLEELLSLPVSGASHTVSNLHNVPSAVTVFTRGQIDALGVDYLHELTSLAPGFQSFRAAESGNEYYHSARGRRTGSASREVLILVDGQRFNRDIDNAQGIPMLMLANVEKVEFIRGPGSAAFGSNAFTGAIRITTRRDENLAKVTVQGGDSRAIEGSLQLNGNLAGWQADMHLQGFDDGGAEFVIADVFTGEPTTISDPRSGEDLRLMLGREQTELTLSVMHRSAEDFFVIENNSNRYNRTDNRFYSATASRKWDTTDATSLKLSAGWHKATYEPQSIVAPAGSLESVSSPPGTEAMRFRLHQEEVGYNLRAQVEYLSDNGGRFYTGATWRRTEVGRAAPWTNYDLTALSEGDYPIEYYGEFRQTTQLYDAETLDMAAAYAEGRWQWGGHTVVAGGRYDDYRDRGKRFSPRLGYIHHFNDQVTGKVLYGEAFRVPSVNETRPQNNPLLIGNPALQPETISTLEGVLMVTWRRQFLTLTLFDNHYQDSIAQVEQAGRRTFTNLSEDSETHGIELEYTSEIGHNWKLRASYTLLDGVAEDNHRQADRLASLILDYSSAPWHWNLSGSYSGERQFNFGSWAETRKLEDYWVISSKLRYRPGDRWSAFIQAKNLADEDYLTPPQGIVLSHGVPNRGSQVALGLDWRF